MAHLNSPSFVAERLVIALDRIVGACLLLKLWCSQIKSPVLIFLHIPFMWTMAFIWYSPAWLWHRRLMNLCNHYIHDSPSWTKGSLMPPPPFFLFSPGKNAIHVHMDCRGTFIGFHAARNEFWPEYFAVNTFAMLGEIPHAVLTWIPCLLFWGRLRESDSLNCHSGLPITRRCVTNMPAGIFGEQRHLNETPPLRVAVPNPPKVIIFPSSILFKKTRAVPLSPSSPNQPPQLSPL